MRNQASISKVERWLLPMTSSHLFLLAFFCAGILAAVTGFRSHKGGDLLAFPLVAWSPFLLILGLEQLARGFRQVCEKGAWRMTLSRSGVCSILVASSCFVLACYLHSSGSIYVVILGTQQLTQGLRKIWNTDEEAMVTARDGAWLVWGAIGLFTFACYIHLTAPVTRP